jgi:tRNA nucleotidyltransferase (CCA-adding enzyme)
VDALVDALRRKIPTEVQTISRTLNQAGHRSWVVGGSVRDVVRATLAGRDTSSVGDWDLASDARPEVVQKLFAKVIPTGIEHGTVTVVLNRQHFEVTTLRGEKGHSDGRRPDEVFFVDDLREDLARRDFTVNAMAFDVVTNEFFDPYGGIDDLKSGLIRAVGDPEKRFAEDGLRVLRCARFCATLGLAIEEATERAIIPSLSSFEKVAQERVSDEWFKALKSASPSRFFRAIVANKMLAITFRQLWSTENTLLSLDETLARLDAAPGEPLERLALFVRAGTPPETAPEDLARSFAARLRFSKDLTARLTRLCQFALLPTDTWQDESGYSARKWLGRVGRADDGCAAGHGPQQAQTSGLRPDGQGRIAGGEDFPGAVQGGIGKDTR